jgi:hypothetical protein
MSAAVVVIPIYQSTLSKNEDISLNRCLEILGSREIVFVSPQSLSLAFYQERACQHRVDFKVEFFDEAFFASVDSYNRLMLSRSFYERFAPYDYMLVYQLDSYVFRDELLDWCREGFDFVGAPLIGHYADETFSTVMRVGNGGFSLRRIESFLQAFDFTKNLLSAKEIIKRYAVFRKVWTRLPLLIAMIFGYRNNLPYFARHWRHNEDDFWSGFLDGTRYALKKPSPEKALTFSFERFPRHTFALTKRLPFGCHAWSRYEYDSFWKQYISV